MVVHGGKGGKDRVVTMFDPLRRHRSPRHAVYGQDVVDGVAVVPWMLERREMAVRGSLGDVVRR